GLGVDRVAVEDRLRELDLLEPEIAHGRAERGLADREPHGDAEREEAVDQRLAELGLGRGVEIDVERLRGHREAGEPHVGGLGPRASGLVSKRLSDLELVEVLSCHVGPPDVVRVRRLTAVVPDSINDAPWKTPTTSRSSAAASSASPPRGPWAS